LSTDPRAGIVRRHHVSDSVIQKAVKAAAVRANIHKPISVHTLRHHADSRIMPSTRSTVAVRSAPEVALSLVRSA
jgi:integrase